MDQHQLDLMAMRVIRGDYGNGQERVARLEAEGYNYDEIQSRVNEIKPDYDANPGKYSELVKEINEPEQSDPMKEAANGDKAATRGKEGRSTSSPSQGVQVSEQPIESNSNQKYQAQDKITYDRQKLTADLQKYRDDNRSVSNGANLLNDNIKINGKEISPEQADLNAKNADKALNILNGDSAATKDLLQEYNMSNPVEAFKQFLSEKLGINLDDYQKDEQQKKAKLPGRDKEQQAETEKPKDVRPSMEAKAKGQGQDHFVDSEKTAKLEVSLQNDKKLALSEKDIAKIKETTQYNRIPAELVDQTGLHNAKEIASEKAGELTNKVKELTYRAQLPPEASNSLMKGISSIENTVGSAKETVSTALNGLKNGYKEFTEKFDKIKDAVQKAGPPPTMLDVIKQKFQESGRDIKGNGGLVSNGAINSLDGIKEQLGKLGNGQDIKGSIIDLQKGVYQKVNSVKALQIENNAMARDQLKESRQVLVDKTNQLQQTLDKAKERGLSGKETEKLKQEIGQLKKETKSLDKSIESLDRKDKALRKDFSKTLSAEREGLKKAQDLGKNKGLAQAKEGGLKEKAIEKIGEVLER